MAAAFGKFSGREEEGPQTGPSSSSTSILGSGTEVVGDVKGTGQLRVEGRVEGNIRMDGDVQVAPGGVVDGRVEADVVMAAGRISGAVVGREAVRLEDGCQVDADIATPVLELEEGGRLNGRIDMSGGESAVGQPRPEAAAAVGGEPRPASREEGGSGAGDREEGDSGADASRPGQGADGDEGPEREEGRPADA